MFGKDAIRAALLRVAREVSEKKHDYVVVLPGDMGLAERLFEWTPEDMSDLFELFEEVLGFTQEQLRDEFGDDQPSLDCPKFPEIGLWATCQIPASPGVRVFVLVPAEQSTTPLFTPGSRRRRRRRGLRRPLPL